MVDNPDQSTTMPDIIASSSSTRTKKKGSEPPSEAAQDIKVCLLSSTGPKIELTMNSISAREIIKEERRCRYH